MSDALRDAPGGRAATALDPLLHEPARLSVLAALAPAEYVDFPTLLQLTGTSKSSLSKHIATLAAVGIVEVTAAPSDKRGRRVALTPAGRVAFEIYLENLEALVRRAKG